MRITHVVATGQFAGTERYVADVARELARRGHDVRVIGGAPDQMPAAAGPDVNWSPGADASTGSRALAAGGRREVVHTHMTKADFIGFGASPITRARQVSTRHITAPRGFSPTARRLAPLVRRALACEIAVSEWTSSQLERPSDVVAMNGVAPVADVADHRDPIVLVAQRLAPEKDTATAVRAFGRSGLPDRGWRLVVAGQGELLDPLRTLVADLRLDEHVEFAGWVQDLAPWYRRASLLLAPAPTEPCGLTVIEAMAAGLPVVAAGAAGHLETVGRSPDAALFAPADDAAAAAHLARLGNDTGGRIAYGDALRTLQRSNFTLGGHVNQIEQIYRHALRRRA